MFTLRKTSSVQKHFPARGRALIISNDLDGAGSSARHFVAMTRSVTYSGTSQRARRYNVVALAFVLCAWLIAVAMHLHVKDQDAGIADSAHCAQCLALSASAAPAPEFRVPVALAGPMLVVGCDDTTFEAQAAPSYYLSRGPPAA